MLESFMACYFNYFHFYTRLWNKCWDFLYKKAYISPLNVIIWRLVKFKTNLLPHRTPKSLIILILLVSNWHPKMFVMVLKKLGDQRKSHCLNCNELHCNAKYIYIHKKYICFLVWQKLSNENKVATEYNSAFLTAMQKYIYVHT